MRTLPILDSTGLKAFAPEPVSIATLNASNQVFTWYEAVAIVQDLCRTLADGVPSVADELGATSVMIDVSGRVSFAGQFHDGHAGVHQLAELLRDMLSEDVPVPLRLALSQSLSSPPFYGSLSEFSHALEYFERPNRNAIIQSVYRRWEQRPPEPQHSNQEKPHAEEPRREPSNPQPARTMFRSRAVLMACATGVVLVLVIIAGLMAKRALNLNAGSRAVEPLRSVGAAVVDAASSVRERVLDRLDPPSPSNPPATAKSSARVAEPQRIEIRAPVMPGALHVPATRVAEVAPVGIPELTGTAFPVAGQRPVVTTDAKPVTIDHGISAAIYSEADSEVIPPVAVYPRVPSAMLGPAPQEAATFDVVIDHAGTVESVKLRRAPRSIANAFVLTMSLSAAKAWRFQPAIRDGQPVRYRKTVWLPPIP